MSRPTHKTTVEECFAEWLQSKATVRICGVDVTPRPHPLLSGAPQCVVKGQASVFWLEQVPQGNTWLLKLFTPGRRPADAYLHAAARCLPGAVEFFTCTQRRFLTSEHLDPRASSYRHPALAGLLEGAILMPKAPGMAWACVADDLRTGVLDLPWVRRLGLALALTQSVDLLEAGQCSHRDLSATNVFVEEQGEVWLIDFDCLYHPDLPFQPNTTVGTMGYIAPFLGATAGHPDPALSWRPRADRFALAVLIAEILLTGPDIGPPQEDGTLFSQSQMDEPQNRFVREIIRRAKEQSRPCGFLLEQAFTSSTFSECPSPQEWISALRWTLRGGQAGQATGGQGNGKPRFVWVRCAECQVACSIAKTRHDELTRKGRAILCKRCLSNHFTKSSFARAQRKAAFPEVSCESCRRTFSLPRPKLDDLRGRGNPILCPACLGPQLAKWRAEQAEHDRSYPRINCATCDKPFRLRAETLEHLQSRGTSVLCRACRIEARQIKRRPETPVPKKETVPTLKPWHLIRRIFHGHST